jgi:hypothetical protein
MPDFTGNFGPARSETARPTDNKVSDADEMDYRRARARDANPVSRAR